jgi:cellulose synthase/poly-beta-1,6-N-acetylglucosamine synthase-like glycosyltransferase
VKTALEILFFGSVGLLLFSQLGYPLVLMTLKRLRWNKEPSTNAPRPAAPAGGGPTRLRRSRTEEAAVDVSLIIAAHDEEAVIADRVAAARKATPEVEIVVACDGCADGTAEAARRAGADLVLDLPRGGKLAAQNAAVEKASGELLAFSDANSVWGESALDELAGAFADPEVGYACGRLRLVGDGGENQEGLYWRYEIMLRELESGLGGITAGNGAIYMTRRDTYIHLDPARSHDGSFPFLMAKRGLRSVYVPTAVAEEPMAPTLGGEFARKRRIMRPLWDVVVLDGMLSPRGYRPLYALQIFSHRLLRYAAPLLHVVALAANAALLGEGSFYVVTLALQLAVLLAAALAPLVPIAPFRIARYYVSVTASIVAGLWDRARLGPRSGGWEKAEGAR